MKPTHVAKQHNELTPSPWSYNTPLKMNKGVRIPTAKKQSLAISQTPAPNSYTIKGDFDFRKPNQNYGKMPKFAHQSEPRLKTITNDTPGPGFYDLHNQHSVGYLIGTAERDPLENKAVRGFPGPGAYNMKLDSGPHVSFTQVIKDTEIVKTYKPGPASYETLNTVGVIPKYLRKEFNPHQSA